MRGKIREILEQYKKYIQGGTSDGTQWLTQDQATTQILEEMDKGMLSEEEIAQIIYEIDEHRKEPYSPNKDKPWDVIGEITKKSYLLRAHALYTAQKERIEK